MKRITPRQIWEIQLQAFIKQKGEDCNGRPYESYTWDAPEERARRKIWTQVARELNKFFNS